MLQIVPTWWKQPNFIEFKKQYLKSKARALFFLGSGISIQAELPNWKGLLEEIVLSSNVILDKSFSIDELEELFQNEEYKDNYPKIGSLLKEKFVLEGKADSWREVLNKIINDKNKVERNSEIHNVIAGLEWHSIITTNYDVLIERAYEKVNKQSLTTSRPDKENELSLERTDEKFIYKIHGDIEDPYSKIVLTESDYDELYNRDNATRAALRGVLRTASVILFAGYSHKDTDMRRFFKEAMKYTNTGNTFALVPIEGDLKNKETSDLSNDLSINFIGYSSEDNHKELVDFFNYLSQPESYDAIYNSRRHARRPTIVMLHCGGTIGSSESHFSETDNHVSLQVNKIESRYSPKLANFSNKLLEWYQETYNVGSDVTIDVQWEIMPDKYQMFSENATPDLWNALLEKVKSIAFKYFQAPVIQGDKTHLDFENSPELRELYNEEKEQYELVFPNHEFTSRQFISGFQSRYVLGIVLLFGTDTLGYAASSLSLGLQHLPCPIVVTGSNQPPDQSTLAQVRFYNNSDAWKNILTSFYFLQSFGHTLTDTFVCFGETIHHGINVRKIPGETGPSNNNIIPGQEPFVYRNLHLNGQYMFRQIDGVFCNNYYSSERITYTSLVKKHGTDFTDLRHIRRNPFQRNEDINHIKRDKFAHNNAIWHVVVSPGFPFIDVLNTQIEENSDLKAVIVEGYASGTYPTISQNNFSKFLIQLYKNSIPIFLISSYGIPEKQTAYETEFIHGIEIPVSTLKGYTSETALPLLSLIINKIPNEIWNTCQEEEELLHYRINLIKAEKDKYFEHRPNIHTLELSPRHVSSTGRESLINNIESNLLRIETLRQEKINRRGVIMKNKFEKYVKQLNSKYVFLYTRDFLIILKEITRQAEKRGIGPDGFANLCDLGFEYGIAFTQGLVKGLKLDFGHGHISLFQRNENEQTALITKAEEVIENVVELLNLINISAVKLNEIKFPVTRKSTDSSLKNDHFTFTITLVRLEEPEYTDEKFATVSFSEDDARFFELLANGCDKEEDLDKYFRNLNFAYYSLLQNKWRNRSTSLDWFILGFFKGVTCGIAQFLRFDDLAVEASSTKDLNYKSAFRKAAHSFVVAGDESVFKMKFNYYQSKTSKIITE